jgi:hypothetical protein
MRAVYRYKHAAPTEPNDRDVCMAFLLATWQHYMSNATGALLSPGITRRAPTTLLYSRFTSPTNSVGPAY